MNPKRRSRTIGECIRSFFVIIMGTATLSLPISNGFQSMLLLQQSNSRDYPTRSMMLHVVRESTSHHHLHHHTSTKEKEQKEPRRRRSLRRRVKAVLQKAKNRTPLHMMMMIRNTYNDTVSERSGKVFQIREAYSQNVMIPDSDGSSDCENYLSSSNEELDSFTSPSSSTATPTPTLTSSPSTCMPLNAEELINHNDRIDPLPFILPQLTAEQQEQLARHGRVQEQSKMGREGSGFVVMDIDAPDSVVWECLLDFEAYPQTISTVKRMTMFTNTHLQSSYWSESPVSPGTGRESRQYGTASVTRASFVLSKFALKIAAIHKYTPHPDGHYMVFTLDPACQNVVLQHAQGIWYTQTIPVPEDKWDRRPPGSKATVTRVWLLCEVKVARILPRFVVDYTAKRAMPRATTWLPPLAEQRAHQLQRMEAMTKASSNTIPGLQVDCS